MVSETKDLGDVRHYLGIQVERGADGSFLLNQGTKIAQLMDEHGLRDAKPVVTQMETGFLASTPHNSPKLPNNVRCRQAV